MREEKKTKRLHNSYAYLLIKIEKQTGNVCEAGIYSEQDPTCFSNIMYRELMRAGGKTFQEAKDKLVKKINDKSHIGLRRWIISLGMDERELYSNT